MATYVIGDIQGCFDSLQGLLEKIDARADDQIWLAGDLVNRGPRSADVLRWAKQQGDRVVAVLGNHDLHLLSMAAGLREPKYRDTAHEVLDGPDADELIDWLRYLPFIHRGDLAVLVHAGLHPEWSVDEAIAHAAELQDILRRDDWQDKLGAMHGGKSATRWHADLSKSKRRRAATAVLTKARCFTHRKDGWHLEHRFYDHPTKASTGLTPWFDAREPGDEHIAFGHWASLGLLQRDDVTATDTGCVWGRHLTAVRLDDDEVFEQPALE